MEVHKVKYIDASKGFIEFLKNKDPDLKIFLDEHKEIKTLNQLKFLLKSHSDKLEEYWQLYLVEYFKRIKLY